MFRKLKANEIELRIGTISAKGCSLLLFKNARCDMNVLDETVGPYNWKREHTRDNSNCIVSIWDANKGQWISKEDTGTESYAEKEKGLASDSFKRACFNWGIGRELYTSGFIWINKDFINLKYDEKKKKYSTYTKFYISKINYDNNGDINELEITNDKSEICFVKKETQNQVNKEDLTEIYKMYSDKCKRLGKDSKEMAKIQGLTTKSSKEKWLEAYGELDKVVGGI